MCGEGGGAQILSTEVMSDGRAGKLRAAETKQVNATDLVLPSTLIHHTWTQHRYRPPVKTLRFVVRLRNILSFVKQILPYLGVLEVTSFRLLC